MYKKFKNFRFLLYTLSMCQKKKNKFQTLSAVIQKLVFRFLRMDVKLES